MSICPNCGAQVPDGSAFCQACGTTISNNVNTAATQQSFTDASKNAISSLGNVPFMKKVEDFFDKTKLIILGVGVVVFIILTVCINNAAVSGPHKMGGQVSVAKKYVKALSKEDKEKFLKLVDDDYLDDNDISKKSVDFGGNSLKKAKKVKILGSSKYTEDEIEKLCDRYEDEGNYEDITAAYEVYFSYVKGHKDPQIDSVVVVKAGGKWRLAPNEANNFLEW